MIKNIIFDWSGTLSDDIIPVYMSAMVIFKKLGIKKITLKEFRKSFMLPYMEFFRKYTPNASKRYVDKIFLQAIYSFQEPKPFPEAKETLKFLNKKGIKMAVMSSHPQEKLEKEVKEYGFEKYFTDVNGSIHDKTKEITKIIARNKFIPKETAYVGDMTHDIDAGKKAKVITIAVSWGYQSKEKLSKKKPDFLIEKLSELKRIVSISRKPSLPPSQKHPTTGS